MKPPEQQKRTARTIARYCLGTALAVAVFGLITGNIQLATIAGTMAIANIALLFIVK